MSRTLNEYAPENETSFIFRELEAIKSHSTEVQKKVKELSRIMTDFAKEDQTSFNQQHTNYTRECLDGYVMQLNNYQLSLEKRLSNSWHNATCDIEEDTVQEYIEINKPKLKAKSPASQRAKGISAIRMYNSPA